MLLNYICKKLLGLKPLSLTSYVLLLTSYILPSCTTIDLYEKIGYRSKACLGKQLQALIRFYNKGYHSALSTFPGIAA